MKTYIAICMTLELKTASKLVETIRVLGNRLILEEHVHCSLLSVGKKTKLACHFTGKLDDTVIKKEIEKLHFNGEADLLSLMEYFNPSNNIVEDGCCFIFCDRFQAVPDFLSLRLDTAFGVFFDLQKYPVFINQPSWNLDRDEVMTPDTAEIFVEEICSIVKSVTGLFFTFPERRTFTASPFPRMPQKTLFDDPEFIYPLDWRPPEAPSNTMAIMEFEGFFPETSMNSLTGRSCTYFLRPGPSEKDENSYFALSKFMANAHKIVLFRRTSGDHFIMRTYRRSPEMENYYLMLEYTTSSSVKFCKPGDEKPKLMFRKHVFSYDVHTSFINKECMEMALNRINRIVKRETDETAVKRELLIAVRQMAVSCHSIFASGLLNIIKNHIATVPRELTNFYKTIERLLTSPEGLKEVALYLEKSVPNSRIKVELY